MTEEGFITKEEELELMKSIERMNSETKGQNVNQGMTDRLSNSEDSLSRLLGANMKTENGRKTMYELMTKEAVRKLAQNARYSNKYGSGTGHMLYNLGFMIHLTPNYTEDQHFKLTKFYLENLKTNIGGDELQSLKNKPEVWNMFKDDEAIKNTIKYYKENFDNLARHADAVTRQAAKKMNLEISR